MITVDVLRSDKLFNKWSKKQQKEVDFMKRRHVKERFMVHRQQCIVIDKLVALHTKERQQKEKALERSIKKNGLVPSRN